MRRPSGGKGVTPPSRRVLEGSLCKNLAMEISDWEEIFNGDFQIVEFGSGNQILCFASRIGFLLRVEDFPDWYEHDQYQFDQKIYFETNALIMEIL